MATASRGIDRDRWKVVPATWKKYLRLEAARGDKARPRYTYTSGRLTIVSPGFSHERMGRLFCDLLAILFEELQIPFLSSGQVTLKQGVPKQKGVEADSSYYLSNIDQIRRKKEILMGVDPPPDLAIEVVVSHPVRDALLVHASFGVREVWVLKEKGLTILKLGENGRYAVSGTSALVPVFISSEIVPWIERDDFPDDGALRRAFRAWVMETLVPRAQGRIAGEP